MVAGMIALRAYWKGIRGPALYLIAGAVIGIGAVVAVTALLAWSKYGVLCGAWGDVTGVDNFHGSPSLPT